MSLLQMNLKAVELRAAHSMFALRPRQLEIAISKRRNDSRVCYSRICASFSYLSVFPPQLDVAIDGADEVDADLTLIKGGG